MLDPTLKDKWIAALRSGTYRQGRMKLRGYENDYCCLGVLCDIYSDAAWDENKYYDYEYDGNSCEINEGILEDIGLDGEVQKKLIGMNDKDQLSFSAIADYIETNL